MQRLLIRLNTDSNAPIHWIVFSEDENEIIASGCLNHSDELASLVEYSESSQVICLVPTSSLYLTDVALPASVSRKAFAAIPFMVEEELCSDISSLFFAHGSKQGEQVKVAAVKKTLMKKWQSELENAGIYCSKMLPDALCLPQSQSINVLAIENSVLALFPNGQALQGEKNWLIPILNQQLEQTKTTITCHSELPELEHNEKVTFNFDQFPMLLLLVEAKKQDLNLFQGEFSVKRKTNLFWDKWKVAASLAFIAISVNLVLKASELNDIKTQRAEIRQQMQQSIKEGFPNLNRVANVRTVISREVAALEQGGGNLSMLAMLSRLSSAFETSGVKPQTIKYDSRRSEIRFQSVARNFESLETFRRSALGLGFEVEQGAINNRGDEVVGLITVRG